MIAALADVTDISGPVWIPTLPPTLENYLAPTLQPIPVLPVVATALLLLYLSGAVRLWLSGRHWPVLRTLSFVLGSVALAIVTGAGIEGYGFRMFSIFMFQQLTLMMAIPPLLVLGRPGTLLLRATPHNRLGGAVLVGARRALRSRAARIAIHPAFMIPLFLLAFYGLYLSDLGANLLRTWVGHTGLEVAFLVSGILFAVPILSQDPLPIRQTHHGRALDLAAELPLHAFFGVIVMMTTTPLVPLFAYPPASWQVDAEYDQWLAGGLAWSYGEAPGLLMILIVLVRWKRSDTQSAIARDREVDRRGDPELDEYNAELARLHGRGPASQASR